METISTSTTKSKPFGGTESTGLIPAMWAHYRLVREVLLLKKEQIKHLNCAKITMFFLEDEVSEKKDDVEKTSGIDGSFFDCNICLDLATDPVVTCCGHCLSAMPLPVVACSFRCERMPVCKGEVTMKNVTSI
ncbi:hypothetical protein Peur_033426 [Populus x canadensis]